MTSIEASLLGLRAGARRSLWWLSAACTLAAPGVARAQSSSDAATARALFTEGRKLLDEGKVEQACPKFQESLRLKPGIGTRFNLADCWEKSGRTASAWGEFLEVANAAKAQGQKDRESVARERARALEGKLSYLVIETEETDPELRVTRDGVEVGRGAFGTAVPIDPGVHAVEASSPNKKPWTASEDIKGGQKARVSIPRLLPLASEAPPAPAPVAQGGAEAPPAPSAPVAQPQDTASSGLGTQRTLGLGLGGLGVIGLTVGTVFLVNYGSTNDQAKGLCPSGTCGADEIEKHEELISEAKTQRTLGYVSLGAGGALLVAGAVLFFTAPSPPVKSGSVRVLPALSQTTQGLSISGSF
jgi:hypothetical protein